FDAIRFGSILENVVWNEETRAVDYRDVSITENTRCAYPIECIPRTKIPCVGGHPKNIVFLTCDAFGVLPPVGLLTPAQATEHFLSGYTAKVAGTEMGVKEPSATFSACFGAAFMVWAPTVYADLLARKITDHGAKVWLVNTGWTGGLSGVGRRIDLAATRAILDAVHHGGLAAAPRVRHPVFDYEYVVECDGVSPEVLDPYKAWPSRADYDAAADELKRLFDQNAAKHQRG
ncbi:MAG: phosphoenolpyruvate carboxykinase (ATP), partial [Planctomycetia bacterium]